MISKNPMSRRIRITILLLIISFSASKVVAQGAQKVFNDYHDQYFDSLKKMDYPYVFPILGKGAYSRGYDLPHAYGLSVIYFTQTQEINITETKIGINGSPQADFSQLIQFGPTIATTNAVSFRPDMWVFPFLNVYGIIGGGTTSTNVTLLQPFGFETSQKFTVDSYGIGATLTGAVGPIWIAWDNNYNFADVSVVVEPVPAFNSSLRIGHQIPDYNHPQRNFSIWIGTFYQNIQNDTRGSIGISEVFPSITEGFVIDGLNAWAETLPPAQRVIAKQIIDKLDEASQGIDVTDTIIDYTLQKEVAAPFNLLFGAQYQHDKNWMLRTEVGVFGKRSQFLLNLNYRFPGFKKNSAKIKS
jgi:hypothetical protein